MTLRDFLERYGVTLAVVGVLAFVLAVLPGNANNQTVTQLGTNANGGVGPQAGGTGLGTSGGAPGSSASGGGGGSLGGGTGGGSTGSGSGATSVLGKAIFGKGLCRSDGREAGISRYAPPCVSFSGSNGGATYRGITATKIKVVRWLGQVDQATQAILKTYKLADDESVRNRSYNAMRIYNNQHTMTYGREVVFENMNASGASEDDRAMRADAVTIANVRKAFAVIEGTPDSGIPEVLATELAHRGVVCICTVSLSKQFYLENRPYIFGAGLPTSDDYAMQIGEYIGKRLAGRKAQWAGDTLNPAQGYTSMTRKFGLLYVTGTKNKYDPEGKRAADAITSELGKYNVKLAVSQGYLYDPGANQDKIDTYMAKFKAAHVTTLLVFVDPLSPILITKSATNQQYFPEWFITGSGLSDTTTAARLYDQTQWSHAFGISPLWVTWEHVNKSAGYRIYHHAMPGSADGDEGVLVNIYAAEVGPVFVGISQAGPLLTPDTFAAGMFKYPRTAGLPGAPLVYYTRESPTAIKDFSEVWYDVTRRGPDERGDSTAPGMMVRADNGKRYEPGHWPRTNAKAFVQAGSIGVSDTPPGGGDPNHEQDGHHHVGACLSCPGFRTVK